MAEEAKTFGAVASFEKPSLCAESLGSVISSLATSLTSNMSEMTKGGQKRAVRMDISRERKGISDDLRLTNDWSIFHGRYVGKFLCWSLEKNDFVELFDFRCHNCGKDTRLENISTEIKESACFCAHCLGASFCNKECLKAGLQSHKEGGWFRRCINAKKMIMEEKIRRVPLPSYTVAIKNQIYNEGAELMVRKFRFVSGNYSFTGIKYVAKESRFVEDPKEYDESHRDFLRTQAMASDMAKSFNRTIDDLFHFSPPNSKWREKVKMLPRINFLEPIIVEIFDADGKPSRLMIEPFLEGKYEKFNNNMGYVKGASNQLSVIAEEEEGDSSSDNDSFCDVGISASSHSNLLCKDLDDKYIPQVFSHYSYEKSNERFMVVDLQGVLTSKSDGTKSYSLTDPVIHTHRHQNEERNPAWKFGRTDRGTKGIKAFFDSHVCTDVCRLLRLQEHSL
uniref:Alpha-type protein kinase domain-containing protein n=1 Tax=Leptocylindrus danicus TaxID=163516 RepID=A0A7S2K561_9STRA